MVEEVPASINPDPAFEYLWRWFAGWGTVVKLFPGHGRWRGEGLVVEFDEGAGDTVSTADLRDEALYEGQGGLQSLSCVDNQRLRERVKLPLSLHRPPLRHYGSSAV